MTSESQRIAIAEACGYVWYRIPRLPSDSREHRLLAHPAIHEYPEQAACWLVRADGTERICNWQYMEREGHVPDYLNDLNAMHEAEKTLTREQLDLYVDALLSLMHEVDPGYFDRINWGHAVELTTATAAQRAEAFLRTIGKWTEA